MKLPAKKNLLDEHIEGNTVSTPKDDLVASEEHYRSLFESSRDGILILDAETGKIIDVNPFLIELLGYPKDKFIDRELWEIGFFKDIAVSKEKFIELQRKETVRYENLPLETVDGHTISVEFISNVYVVNKTKLIQCNIRDISKRKRIEVAQEATRKELEEDKVIDDELYQFAENIIDTVREPMLLLNDKLRVVKASRPFYEYFRVKPDETIGKLIYELGNHQWDIPKLRALLENILPEKTTFDDYEVEHVFPGIGKRTLLLNARQIKRKFGLEKIILLAFEDITDRKLAEDSLAEKERLTNEYLDILFNSAQIPILIWDSSLVIIRVNQAFKELTGYDWEEAENKKIDFLFPKGKTDSSLKFIKDILANKKTEIIEVEILTKYNEIKTVLWNSANVFDSEGKVIIATVAQDITKRKKSEVALAVLETRYRRLFESAREGILIIDAESGKIIDVNPFLINLLGYGKENFIDKDLWETGFLKDIVANKEKFLELQRNEYVRYDNLPLETFDGRKINVEFVSNVYLCNNIKVIQCNIRDITEQTKIQTEIKFQAHLINNVGQAIIATDLLGIVIYWNNAAEKIYGWSPAEAIGQNIINLTPTQQSNEQSIDIMKQLSEGKTWAGEFYVKRKDGSSFAAFVTDTPILDSNGNLTGIIGISSDITERKQIQQKINDSEKRFRTIFDQAPFAIALIDTQGHILISNIKLSEMIGYSLDELSRMKFTDFTYPEDIDKDMKSFTDLTSGKIDSYTMEKRYFHKSGAIVWVNLNVSLLNDVSSNETEILGMAEDITERKRSEKKLKQSEEKFRSYIENAPNGVFVANEKGGYIDVNKSACSMLGYSEDELLKISIPDILSEESYEDGMNRFKKLQHEEVIEKCDLLFKCKDGGKKWFSLDAVKISETRFLGFTSNITDRKQMEIDLIAAKDKAEENDRLKTAFLANMSHEIRTPMNGILGFTDLLKSPKLSGEEQQEYISIIEKSGDRLLNIINNIINISKIESGHIESDISETNVNEQVEFIYNFFKPIAEEKDLQIFYKNSLPNNEAIVLTDKDKILAIFTNLVNNAIKFTAAGFVEFGYVKKGNFLEFYVKDTGVGIPREQEEIIFERFRQGSESLSRDYEGAGLGLSISKAYVKMLGGKIWVEVNSDNMLPSWSDEKRGSTFFFTIPYNTVHNEKATEETSKNDVPIENKIGNLKILIAEDDEISKELISIVTKDFSREIIIVGNGIEAVKAFKNNPDFDLVLMDIKMPVMDGLEATRQIRQFNKDLIIIAQTAFAFPDDRERAFESGCNDFITKPIRKEVLINILNTYFKN